MIEAVIFDFDDTLADTTPALVEAKLFIAAFLEKKHSLSRNVFIPLFDETEKKYSSPLNATPQSNDRAVWLRHIFSKLHITADPRAITNLYWKQVTKHSQLFPGTLKTLKKINEHTKLGLLSDSDGLKRYKIERLNKHAITPYFKKILTSDDTHENKPSKINFTKITQLLNSNPKNTIMIGNNLQRDIKPAKELGMTTIWSVESKFKEGKPTFVDYKISEISQAIPIITNLLHPNH